VGHRQKGKGGKRRRSWHAKGSARRFVGATRNWPRSDARDDDDDATVCRYDGAPTPLHGKAKNNRGDAL
jgi:hypothetical protein